ncbi:MAG: permease-like cell division protein FtsX [Coriobacteriia bacterium]|nr:permease-like cell division protein FtsX [Coriobacteriia bacterium]
MSSLFYFIKESLVGFTRNLSTTLGSIITIFLSLLIIGVFLMGGVVVGNVVASVEDEVSITAYLADKASEAEVVSLENYVKGLDGVSSVEYTSKEQALTNFKESMSSNPDIIEQMGNDNPLPASLTIQLSEPERVADVAKQIEKSEAFTSICDNKEDPGESLKYGQKTVEKLFSVTSSIRNVGVAIIALLIFIALVFINNTIRLAILSRRKEISIMRLVGASNGFIRGPFLMEAILHAVIGSVLAIGVVELLRRFALPQLSSALAWLPLTVSGHTMLVIYVGLLAAGLVIALLGSAFAMRRYLKA